MATTFLYRTYLIIPDAKKAAFVIFWDASMFSGEGATVMSTGYSASGSAPATYWAICTALIDAKFTTLMQQLCTLSLLVFPGGWGSFTYAQKKQWVVDNKAAILSGSGITVSESDNDGTWDNFVAIATAASVSEIMSVP